MPDRTNPTGSSIDRLVKIMREHAGADGILTIKFEHLAELLLRDAERGARQQVVSEVLRHGTLNALQVTISSQALRAIAEGVCPKILKNSRGGLRETS